MCPWTEANSVRVPRGPGWGKSVVVGFGISQLPCAEKNVTHGEHRVLRVRVPKLLEACLGGGLAGHPQGSD